MAGFEGIIERTKAIRDLYTDLCMEVSRLGSRSQLTREQLKAMMTTYGDSLLEKTAEIQRLQTENDELRAEIQATEATDELAEERLAMSAPPLPSARTKPATYIETARRDPKPGQSQAKGAKKNSRKKKKDP